MKLENLHLEFVEKLQNQRTMRGAFDCFEHIITQYGYKSFVYGFMCKEDALTPSHPNVFFETTIEPDIMDIYYEEGGVANDPIAKRVARLEKVEFYDLENPGSDELEFKHHLFRICCLDTKIDVGTLIPLRNTHGVGSILLYSDGQCRRERITVAKNGMENQFQHLVGVFHEIIHGKGLFAQNFNLTTDELDTLQFIARGETASDLSDRKKISQRAIEKRLENVRRKLGAVNTPNAIYRAVILGLL